MAVTYAKWLKADQGPPTLIRAVIDGVEIDVEVDNNDANYRAIMAAVRNKEIEIDPASPIPVSTNPYEQELTPRQFEWMLSYYALEDVWSAIVADAKANRSVQANRNLYANLRAQEKAGGYRLADTLYLMQQVRDRPQIVNSGLDLSDEAIRGYWKHASVQDFRSLTEIVPMP